MMRRRRMTQPRLERLVRDYTDASAAFTSAQSSVGSFDDLLLAFHRRKGAVRALEQHGFTVDQAYARLAEMHREAS